jgi:hypothetical protein
MELPSKLRFNADPVPPAPRALLHWGHPKSAWIRPLRPSVAHVEVLVSWVPLRT